MSLLAYSELHALLGSALIGRLTHPLAQIGQRTHLREHTDIIVAGRPSQKHLAKIAELFGCSLEDLIMGLDGVSVVYVQPNGTPTWLDGAPVEAPPVLDAIAAHFERCKVRVQVAAVESRARREFYRQYVGARKTK